MLENKAIPYQFTGWTMVFKLVAGIPGRPATAWNLPFTTFEYSLAALNSDNDFKHHYKNRIVQKWRVFAPSEVTCMQCGVVKAS